MVELNKLHFFRVFSKMNHPPRPHGPSEAFFVTGPIESAKKVFAEALNSGNYADADPNTLALRFYSPIYFLVQKYDMRASETLWAKDEISETVRDLYRADEGLRLR